MCSSDLAKLNEITLDYISLGEMQPERDHNLVAENSRVGDFLNRKYRYAYEHGWFDFDMKCNSDEPLKLLMTFWGGDGGRGAFEVVVDDNYIFPLTFSNEVEKFIEVSYTLPQEVTKGKDKVRVKFRGTNKNRVCNLYDCRLMKEK